MSGDSVNFESWAKMMSQEVATLKQQLELEQSKSASSSSRGSSGGNIKPPKPDCFHGYQRKEKVDLWLFEMEQYFAVVGLQDPQRVPFAASFLRNSAATWWRSRTMTGVGSQESTLLTWSKFSKAIMKQFKPINSSKVARDKLHQLRQTGSVLQLTHVFNTLCADVPSMTEEEKMDKFLRACKSNVQQRLELEEPKSLFEMQSMAQRLDEIHWKFSSSKLSSSSRNSHHSHRSHRNPDAMELDALEEDDDDEDSSDKSEDEDEDDKVTVNAIKHKSRFSKRKFKKFDPKKSKGTKLTDKERKRCIQSGLCFKCKKSGHQIRDCPEWKKSLKENAH